MTSTPAGGRVARRDGPVSARNTAFFAGPLFPHDAPWAEDLRRWAGRAARDHGVAQAFGAAAAGSDLLIADALIDAGVGVTLVLPFPPERFRTGSVSPFGRQACEAYDRVLRACERIIVLHHPEAASPDYVRGAVTAMGLTRKAAHDVAGDAFGLFALRPGSRDDTVTGALRALWGRALGPQGVLVHIIPAPAGRPPAGDPVRTRFAVLLRRPGGGLDVLAETATAGEAIAKATARNRPAALAADEGPFLLDAGHQSPDGRFSFCTDAVPAAGKGRGILATLDFCAAAWLEDPGWLGAFSPACGACDKGPVGEGERGLFRLDRC